VKLRSHFASRRADHERAESDSTIRPAVSAAESAGQTPAGQTPADRLSGIRASPPGGEIASPSGDNALDCDALASDQTMAPRRRAIASLAVRGLTVCLVALLLAAPWLMPQLVWCGWLGAAAALLLASRLPGWSGFCWSSCWALLAVVIAFHWSPRVLAYTMNSSYALGMLVFVPLVLWDATRSVLPIWVAGRLAGSAAAAWLPAALLAVVLEVALPCVFPWCWGYSQVAWPWTLQAVDLFGPQWSTFIFFAHAGAILALGQALYAPLRSRPRNSRAYVRRLPSVVGSLARSGAIWLCLANLLYSAGAMAFWSRQIASSPTLRVALVQVDPTFKESPDDLRRLTATIADQVDLVCWPESSGGSYESSLRRLSDPHEVFKRSREPNQGLRPWENPACELLLGAKIYSGDKERPAELYQSAILLDTRESIVGRYDKRYLMPFGEFVPGEDWVPGMNYLFSMQDVVSSGSQPTVLPSAAGAKLGVMLCYEDMMPAAARSLVEHSANVLVSLINASAFTDPLTLAQHRMLSQLRAVECRRYFLRCSATGETCVISPLGTIEATLPVQTQGVLTARVALVETPSVHCRIGDVFSIVCCVALVGYLAVRLAARRANRQPVAAVASE
jgi:apolipoprotein N-acyltransferase